MSNYTFIIQNTPKYNLELSTIVNKYSISLRSATGPTGPKGDKVERIVTGKQIGRASCRERV